MVGLVVAASHSLAAARGEDRCCERAGHPHRQALKGSVGQAPVEIVEAPPVGGKGGGIDPGNDYPSALKHAPQDSILDQWKEYNRECTSFVAWALHERNGFEMPFYKNANRWGPAAKKRGFTVNQKPGVGSVAWSNQGVWGHVAYVTAVDHGNVTVEEYNFLVRGGYDKRTVTASGFTGFIHFKDFPEPVDTSTGNSPSGVLSPGSEVTGVARPVIETVGGIANTWTDYRTAGGIQGPSMLSNLSVEVTCKVTGFRVEDGDTWWYRIATSPWNNAYYATADAFYNNGQTTGSLIGTPLVDPAVSDC